MKDSQRPSASKGGDTLYEEIARLRAPGIQRDIKDKLPLPQLARMAAAICPNASHIGPEGWDEESKQIRKAILQAAERVEHDRYNYADAIPAMWGASERFLNKPHDTRRDATLRILFTPRSVYDKRHRKQMAELLEAELRELYAEAQTADEGKAETGENLQDARRDQGASTAASDESAEPTPTGPESGKRSQGRAESAATTKEAPSLPHKPPPRLARVLAALAAAGLVLALIARFVEVDVPLIGVNPEPSAVTDQNLPLPSPESVVNARTGQVDPAPVERPVPDGARVEGGPILRVCNLSSEDLCSLKGLQPPIPARGGDILEFRVRLYNPSVRPLSKLHVGVLLLHGSEHPKRAFVSPAVGWNEPGELNSLEGANQVEVAFPSKSNRLTYIHGSTKLLDSDRNFVGRLPNGIDGEGKDIGLLLTELGPPRSCPTCNPRKYERYISFKAEVE